MFEQSIYEPEPVVTPQEEGDMFYKYEIKSWEFSPRIAKILAASFVVNVLAIAIAAQTSLLTMKGCDSPLVGRVCQALDVVYVSSLLFGTERDYVDVAYERTKLGDDVEVTFVDVTGATPPISYPEGYFQISNPEMFAESEDDLSGTNLANNFPSYNTPYLPPPSGRSLIDTPPTPPRSNPNVIEGDLPTFGNSGNTPPPATSGRKRTPGGRVTRPQPLPSPVEDGEDDENGTVAVNPSPDPTPLSTDALTSIEINRKPLTDFADEISSKWAAKEIDLNQPFVVVLNGVLTKDGKLDREKSKFDVAKQQGSPEMIDVAKMAIEAVGDSGFLAHLTNMNVEKVTVTLVQNEDQLVARIVSEQKTVERARQIQSGLSLLMSGGKGLLKNPSDELTLLENAVVVQEGKNFVLNFALPKPVAQEMINRRLSEAQAKKLQEKQPSSNVDTREESNVARK
ncbi:MAG: hypothetical protein KF881_02400 [Acidobacteria bacterium]|nr:hypothetical protein [Acidobacteriota bacterium]